METEMNRRLLLATRTLWVFLALLVWCPAAGEAREPFFSPAPPMEAYDFAGAAQAIKLRGLLRTDQDSRAVVYLQPLRVYQVVRPRDLLEVTLDGLRHEFRVEAMAGRRLILRGMDGQRYEIGVEQRE